MSLGRIGSLNSLPALLSTWRDPVMQSDDREIEQAIRDVVIRSAYSKVSLSLPTEFGARIQNRIDSLNAEQYSLMGYCKKELGALPVHSTLIYLWAIHPVGTVLCIDHEAFGYPSKLETEPCSIFAAWVHAAESYPELTACIPQPLKEIEPCKLCRARGYSKQGAHCSYCFGLGWLIS